MSNPTIVPIEHASLVLLWGTTTIYVDPVGDVSLYAAQTRPDVILVTHEHHDHYNADTLAALMDETTLLVTNPAVAELLPSGMKQNLAILKNGDTQPLEGFAITAIPAYNIRPEALKYHPLGRDNGYVIERDGTQVYVAGDTEGTPEMRALKNIDVAFVPMNLPYTMSVEDAADAVLAFKPKIVYPYHYRDSDVAKFKELVTVCDPNITVVLGNWYPK